MFILFAMSAQANQYPLSSISLLMSINCQSMSATVLPNIYEIRTQVQNASPDNGIANQLFQDAFEGNSTGFSYTTDTSGRLVLTKKKSVLNLFGSDTSITLGTSDLASLCQQNPGIAPQPMSVTINLLPNVQVSESVDWTGDCSTHSHWPNGQGDDYYKPFTESLNFSDGNSNISLTIRSDVQTGETSSNGADQSLMNACNAASLP
jgi:hypothetical protein